MRKGYFGCDDAQIHYRMWPAENDVGHAPIIMLPPAPHSGLFFETAACNMCTHHTVYAVDYPGYGGSNLTEAKPTIEAYAKALRPFMQQFTSVTFVGFHTGNLVAIELAANMPTPVNSMILIDVPYFDQATRDKYASNLGPDGVPEDIKAVFDKDVKGDNTKSRARSYALWVESQRAFQNRNDAFRAAFAYDVHCRAKIIQTPTVVCGTDSSLFNLSKQAANDMTETKFIDWRHYKSPAFEMDDGKIGFDIIAQIT